MVRNSKKPRRATRVGGEDPDFNERAWLDRLGEAKPGEPGGGEAPQDSAADAERIRREKPPHW